MRCVVGRKISKYVRNNVTACEAHVVLAAKTLFQWGLFMLQVEHTSHLGPLT